MGKTPFATLRRVEEGHIGFTGKARTGLGQETNLCLRSVRLPRVTCVSEYKRPTFLKTLNHKEHCSFLFSVTEVKPLSSGSVRETYETGRAGDGVGSGVSTRRPSLASVFIREMDRRMDRSESKRLYGQVD